MPSDTERLDYLERRRASVDAVTQDTFDSDKLPELLRWSVRVDEWKVTVGAGVSWPELSERQMTLRDAIDECMVQEKANV